MDKVYIGVTTVSGHKLWGGGRQEGCGVRWFGGMGGRWKIDGRRRGGCGPGMPGPYGGVVEGAVYFQHSAHVNVENTCNFYLIIIV